MAVIRLGTPADAEALHRLNEAFNGGGVNTPEGVRQSLLENGSEIVAVAERDAELVGFCCARRLWSVCYAARYAEISELYVDPAHRRQGIAAQLIGFLESSLRREGIAHFQLFTGGENLPAQALYESLGYASTDEVMYRKRPQA